MNKTERQLLRDKMNEENNKLLKEMLDTVFKNLEKLNKLEELLSERKTSKKN